MKEPTVKRPCSCCGAVERLSEAGLCHDCATCNCHACGKPQVFTYENEDRGSSVPTLALCRECKLNFEYDREPLPPEDVLSGELYRELSSWIALEALARTAEEFRARVLPILQQVSDPEHEDFADSGGAK